LKDQEGSVRSVPPALADVAARLTPDGKIDPMIVEMLNETNEILDDMTVIEYLEFFASTYRINGKHKIDRLLFDNAMDGKPMIQVFENYYDVFRCMETLVREDVLKGRNPEDVKKVDGDDAYDMLRYALTNLKQPAGDEGKKANTRQPGQGMRL